MTKTIALSLGIGIALAATGIGLSGAAAQRRGPAMSGGFPFKTGEEVYTHICQGCHMPDAKGAVGAGVYGYPALAGDPKLAANVYPVMVILNGQKAMPAFADLSDEQIAAVTNYVRTHFGNRFTDAVSPDQVKALRPAATAKENKRPG